MFWSSTKNKKTKIQMQMDRKISELVFALKTFKHHTNSQRIVYTRAFKKDKFKGEKYFRRYIHNVFEDDV